MQPFISPQTALIIVGCISILLLSFGFYVSRKFMKNANDYMFAGRNVGLALSTATLIAAWVTGNTTMSAPELGYTIGILAVLTGATAGLGLVIFAPLALRIKKLMPNGYTSGDFMRVRFGNRVWKLYMILSVYYFLGFLMTQAMAGGLLLQALSGLDYKIGMLIIMGVCTLYTLKGGFKAVIATDFMLSLLILTVLFITGVLAFSKFGVTDIYEGVRNFTPDRLNMLTGAGLMFLGSTFLFSCGEIFHSNMWWQRIYASNAKVVARSFIFSGLIWTTVPIVAGSLAFIAIANQYTIPQVNMVFPIVASQLLGTAGAIMVLVVVYSALTSTFSSLLTSSANLIVQDIYRQMINPKATDEQLAKYAKYVIIALSLITVVLTWEPRTSMYKLLLLTGPAVSAMIWPIAYGIFNKESNKLAAFWAMLIGMGAGLCGYFFVSPYAAAIFATVASGIVMVIGTKIAPDTTFKWRNLDESMKPEAVSVPESTFGIGSDR